VKRPCDSTVRRDVAREYRVRQTLDFNLNSIDPIWAA
jgi:hypothetical protein